MRHAHDTPSSTSTTAHRDKRSFQQSSITSFFAREAQEEEDEDWEERGSGPITRSQQHHARDRVQRESLVPNVPGSVQANLLSVGMRVRKSVPEGYKTHKSANLPSIQTTLSKGGPLTNSTIATSDAYSVKLAGPEVYQHQRELLPFSGLHKIGGYAEQPVTNVHLYGGTDENGDRPVNLFPLPAQAFNQPFSSQDSTSSSLSISSLQTPNPTNLHKRSWQDDDGQPLNLNSNFLFALPMKVSEDEVPVSPLSATPAPSILSLPQSALRPFAQPKTRRHQSGQMMEVSAVLFKEADIDMDLENAEQNEDRATGNSNDFGEAEFLRPWSGREVAMGGV
ncbi:hypothetical protein K505DRAFT_328244 [Melanomma pulvis-pyrius CBS 109.77]|uniref:Uncharacterized protein n=1 Tax=Melanomma pulvis-pyrius CBS 109.77 TaxID=1314802 RepID=A0A6A6WZS4_9PLEO|nr:hypothetical protein K505DRAFT_328244 [Melanomma pulvis-pyrius CBS 109.77]